MDMNRRKEQFSLAYIRAVAARAGYQALRPEVDVASVDGQIMADYEAKPLIYLQAKSTARNVVHAETVNYPLPLANYDDLRSGEGPLHILIVVVLPDSVDDWTSQDEEGLILRRCGYWLDLRGSPESQSKTTHTVHIPRRNVFNPDQLQELMNGPAMMVR